MALIADIADALVAALNGGDFGQSFTARRAYRPTYDLKDMKDLHVTVVPRSVEISTANRALGQYDVQIDVAVQKKLTIWKDGDESEIDGLMAVVANIAAFIRRTRVFGNATFVRIANEPIYSPDHLTDLRQFTSVLTVTLRAYLQ